MDISTRQWAHTSDNSLFATHYSQCTLKSKLAIDREITFSWI
jgi:hypothetical protein